MSKKSRKKQKAEKPQAKASAQEAVDAVESTQEMETIEAEVAEETVVAAMEISGDAAAEGDEERGEARDREADLPVAVSEESLHGSVPEGEVPPLSHVIEAILFASQKAVTAKELAAHLKNAATAEPASVATAFARVKESDIRDALLELQAEVAASGRAYQVRETATGWLLSSAPGFAPWLRALYPEAKPTRLSPSALETLAIISYRQPITRADMEAVRGVSVDGVMQTLLDRGLVKIAGRAEVPGRPLLYATTQYFLDHFGLRNLDELPNAAELRHIPLPKAAPERGAIPGPDDSAPDLPGVSEENGGAPEAPAEAVEAVEVTDIIEVRESVVFEEVSFDAEEPAQDPEKSGSESEEGN